MKWSEFVTVTVEREKILTPERIMNFFNLFDKERKNEITSLDLIKVFDRKSKISTSKWDEIVSEAVNNEERNINLDDIWR